MYNYLHYIAIMWRLPFTRAAGVSYLDVIWIYIHSCVMITDTSLASQAHANSQLPV